jgi:hypothetical protein
VDLSLETYDLQVSQVKYAKLQYPAIDYKIGCLKAYAMLAAAISA